MRGYIRICRDVEARGYDDGDAGSGAEGDDRDKSKAFGRGIERHCEMWKMRESCESILKAINEDILEADKIIIRLQVKLSKPRLLACDG